MKKMILTKHQLNEVLKEENSTTVQINSTGNNLSSVTNAITNNRPEINNASKFGDVDIHVSNPNSNGSNDSIPTQHVEVGSGDDLNKSIQQQVNTTLLSNGGDLDISGKGISEHKIFTKLMVEEARLNKLKNDGTVLTKAELQDTFFI